MQHIKQSKIDRRLEEIDQRTDLADWYFHTKADKYTKPQGR